MINKNQSKLNIIKCIRLCYDMTQTDFAKLIDCSQVFLGEIEKNEKRMSDKKLLVALSRIGMDLDTYQKLEKYKKQLDKKEMEHIKKFRLLLLKVVKVLIQMEKENQPQQEVSLHKAKK